MGRGATSVVYKARQVSLNRVVALKKIQSPGPAEPQALARFQIEAKAIASLQHPHIVQIFEVGEDQGQPYLCLEYVDGGSLAEFLKNQPQLAEEAARLLTVLADAIHYAHQLGIVHRDLKPANILLKSAQPEGVPLQENANPSGQTSTFSTTAHFEVPSTVAPALEQKSEPLLFSAPLAESPRAPTVPVLSANTFTPKITDFGLAKQMNVDSGQTKTGAVLGTPSYMAPEQAEGQIHQIGPATDVYALGAIFYEMLTGRPPFLGKTLVEILGKVQSLEPVSPRWFQPNVPLDLETICLKCLEKKPESRYPSALDLAEDLRRFQRGEPIRRGPWGGWSAVGVGAGVTRGRRLC